MQAGFRGTFVISWAQTELDGQTRAPLGSLRVGQCWRWAGDPVRIDGPTAVLTLADADGMAVLRKRAAHAVRRLLSAVDSDLPHNLCPDPYDTDDTPPDRGFTVTDGHQIWTVTLIDTGSGKPPLVMFLGDMPPRQTDLWVVAHKVDPRPDPAGVDAPGGVICFTPGTMILTEDGPCPVEHITEGTRIQTKDNGCQDVLWIGKRRISGARLHVMPHLAPVRLREGALDKGVPDAGLLVSPGHRLMLRGARALALFNTDEVLVAARDLVNDSSVYVDRLVRDVTYIHLLLTSHEIVFANGVETDSFHPASAALDTMDDAQRIALFNRLPGSVDDPSRYGDYARRVLTQSEAAILRYDQR